MNTDSLKLKMAMIDLGILPAVTGKDLTCMLKSLDASERRKVKRRFRKVWKKVVKQNPDIADSLCTRSSDPTKDQLRNRAVRVVISIANEIRSQARDEDGFLHL
jgi:hypothetical protein